MIGVDNIWSLQPQSLSSIEFTNTHIRNSTHFYTESSLPEQQTHKHSVNNCNRITAKDFKNHNHLFIIQICFIYDFFTGLGFGIPLGLCGLGILLTTIAGFLTSTFLAVSILAGTCTSSVLAGTTATAVLVGIVVLTGIFFTSILAGTLTLAGGVTTVLAGILLTITFLAKN